MTAVIQILQKLVNQLQEEAAGDDGLFTSFKCYCKNNKEKFQLQLDQDKSDADRLSALWKDSERKSAEKAAEFTALQNQIDSTKLQLEDARMRRKTENEEYFTESTAIKEDQRQILEAINAIATRMPGGAGPNWKSQDILSSLVQGGKGNGANPEEITTGYFDKHAESMRKLATKYLDQDGEDDMSDALESMGGKALSFLQTEVDPSKDQIMHSLDSAGGQLGVGLETVIGYLSAMRDSAAKEEADLEEEESNRVKSFNEMQKALQSQISSMTSTANKKKMMSAEAKVVATAAQGDFEQNQNRIASAQKFLDELVANCDKKKSEYDELRVKRQQEITAATQAMEILQGARIPEVILSPALLETSSRTEPLAEKVDSQTAASVVSALQDKVASKSKQVSMLTYMLKTANIDFRSVLKVLENLLSELKDEQDRDDHHLSNCILNLENSAEEESSYTGELERLNSFIAEEQATITEAKEMILALDAQNKDLDEEAKAANKQRTMEREQYDKVLSEKQDEVKVVDSAVHILRSVYEATVAVQEDEEEWTLPAAESLVQISAHVDLAVEAAPVGPGEHKLKDQGFDAIALLAEIANDLKIEITVMQKDEQDSIRVYQQASSAIGNQQAQNDQAIATKNYQKAEATSRMGEFQVEAEQAESKLAAAKALHDSRKVECESYVNAPEQETESGYDKRKRLRQTDMDNLVRAKSILTATRR